MQSSDVKDLNLNELLVAQEETSLVPISKDNVFKIDSSEFELSLRISTFTSAKEFDHFIKNVEKLVRVSHEYRLWICYIIENLGTKECALTHERMNECSIDIHHHPINLYTIVKSVINDLIRLQQEFSTFDVAARIIELHYQNKIGYIALLSDLHEKYHSGFLKLPIELVKGDYKYLLKTYNFEEEELQRIYELCNTKSEDVKLEWSRNNYPGLK